MRSAIVCATANFPAPAETRKAGVLIVGAGISGLSAAWKLAKAGVDDFLLLEMEASRRQFARRPVAARRLPVGRPLPAVADARGDVAVRELLAELGVLHGDPAAAKPAYDERYLCATPQERVYRNGLWEEGMLPHRGLPMPPSAKQQRASTSAWTN
jgi:choline dehydrogenase-like flavoprotein